MKQDICSLRLPLSPRLRTRLFAGMIFGVMSGAVAVAGASGAMAKDGMQVVTSIKPIHSLVSAVMKGVGKPHLIIKGAGSPHTYSLKPSDAGALEQADLIFWIGPDIEAFLTNSIKSLGSRAENIKLGELPNLVTHKFRIGGPFEKHSAKAHGSHDEKTQHEEGEDHKKEALHEHENAREHDEHKEHKEHDEHDEHEHDEHDRDNHIWLDPVNAQLMVRAIAAALVKADPGNAKSYEANAREADTKLAALSGEIKTLLGAVKKRPFIVFHDAYQYFEHRFGLNAVGSITVSPEIKPGAKRVRAVREKVKRLGAVCVFSEPQFQPKLVQTLTEGTSARTGVLDPLGSGEANGSQLYFTVLRNMAKSMEKCLSGSAR